MKSQTRKHGFTIVELVIVIAVIAILAAVLIPTFVNLVKKADAANAQVEAKNLITEMLANILTENEGENKADLLVFSHKGNDVYLHGYDASEGRMLTYNGELASFTSGEFKAHVETLLGTLTAAGALKEVTIADANDWRNPAKTAEIVSGLDAKNDMIVYANYEILASFTEGAGTKVENSADLSSEVAKGGKVVLTKDITVDGKLTVSKDTILDLGNKTITGPAENYTIEVAEGATLTIRNGNIINADASNPSSLIRNSGTLVIEGGTFKTAAGSAVVKNEPTGVLTINGGEFSITREQSGSDYFNAVVNYGTATINGGKFSAVGGAAFWNEYYENNHGTATINGGEFVSTLEDGVYGAAVCNRRSTLTVNGGTFTGWHIGLKNDNGSVDNSTVLRIYGGEFHYSATMSAPWYALKNDESGDNIAEIYGGEFHGIVRDYNGSLQLSGGTYYESKPSDGVSEDYEVKDNGDGTWTVSKK